MEFGMRQLQDALTANRFPSPCGVRRVRDAKAALDAQKAKAEFPSPCGVRRVRDFVHKKQRDGYCDEKFPSPCGVRRVRDPPSEAKGEVKGDVSVPLRGKEGAGPLVFGNLI